MEVHGRVGSLPVVGIDRAPQRADAATLLDVAVHVGGHPWTLTSVISEHTASRTGGATSVVKLAHRAAQPVQAVVSHAGAVTSIAGVAAVAVDHKAALARTRAASWMPDSGAL